MGNTKQMDFRFEDFDAEPEKLAVAHSKSARQIPLLSLKKMSSAYKGANRDLSSVEKPDDYDKRSLPALLVDIFELILLLKDENNLEMDDVHDILFILFKKLISELDLETIIVMNKILVQSKTFNSMLNYRAGKRDSTPTTSLQPRAAGIRSKSKLIEVSLRCFQEIILILKNKLTDDQNDDRVLLMFGGIIEFILREMYASSQEITDMIYNLLKDILDIRPKMEETVCESLFSCIKSNYNQMTQEKTKQFLQNVLNKINPRVFINILINYMDKKLFSQEDRVGVRLMVLNDLLDYITVILAYSNSKEDIVAELLFGDAFNEEIFKLWSLCPVALMKAGLLCKKFDFSFLLLEKEVEENMSNNSNLLQYMRYAEEMLEMVDSFKFSKIISSIKNPRIKAKLVRLIGALVMLAPNSERWVNLLKKIKANYCRAEIRETVDEETSAYDLENKALFDLYLKKSLKVPSYSRVLVRTFS